MNENGFNGSPGPVDRTPDPALPAVPGFEIFKRIGKGGMGEVFAARQLTLGRLVAVKILNPVDSPDPEMDLARFRREAELMAKVSHPNILSVHDFGEVNGRPYLVMEYVEGGDLRRRMPPGRPVPEGEVRSVVLPVGEALAYLHRHGIIHRDLKPENILLYDGHNPRVTDFGIAVLRTGSGALTRPGWGMGTLGYVAPEQQYSLKVDDRADQYSLAALTYEMLTGHLPLGIYKPPSHLNPALGLGVDAVILRALQEAAKDRYPTIREFTSALDQSLSSTPPDPGRPRLRKLSYAAFGLAVVVAGFSVFPRIASFTLSPARAPVVGPPEVSHLTPALPAPDIISSTPSRPEPAKDPDRSPSSLDEELKSLRARKIWEDRGRPSGEAGKALKDEIWFEAVGSVEEDLKRLAYSIWQERGSLSGAEGEAIREDVWREAQRRLLKTMSEERPPRPQAR